MNDSLTMCDHDWNYRTTYKPYPDPDSHSKHYIIETKTTCKKCGRGNVEKLLPSPLSVMKGGK